MCTNAYRQALMNALSSTRSSAAHEEPAMEPPRSLQQRTEDTLGRLESDADALIAGEQAQPYQH
jgi:hypothetical protein